MVFKAEILRHISQFVRSMVGKSNVSACHISSSLMAVLGMKLLPTSHGWRAYQSFACLAVQGGAGAAVTFEEIPIRIRNTTMVLCIRVGKEFSKPHHDITFRMLAAARQKPQLAGLYFGLEKHEMPTISLAFRRWRLLFS